jgi:tetratricopeptide (TPR) repeat protein
MVSDLYLQALAESSARKSELRRRGVSGELDMLRSFAAQGRADANFVASVQYNPQIQDAIQAMRKEENSGFGDLNRKSELLNEITRRYDSSLEITPSPTIGKITRLSSIYYLATSPAYYLQNLTQPWIMSVPAMAGRHDYLKASAALSQAYGQLGDVMKSARLFDQQFDFGKVPSDVRAAIQELVNRGAIDIGMETELGEFKIEGDSAFTKGWNKVDKGLRIAVQKVESINRLSTAMAAYRLELARSKGNTQAAIDYAEQILTETHGDYSAFNAPRIFNTQLGKVALQFRKFQLIQLSFYAKLLKDAGFSTEEKRAATKTLMYSLGHTGMLAGAMGLPGYSAIAWAIGALFGDDDDPLDVTAELRKFIGDEDMANLIMRGAPTLAGVDISGKVGAGNMLSIMPFSQADLTTRAGVIEAAGTLLGGAPVGMVARVADGLGLMLNGDWYRGTEQVLPKGLGDAVKAYRIADQGMTRRNGDVVLPSSEVSAAETFMQAIGIQPVQQTVAMERQQATVEMNQFYQDRSTKIKAQYVKAIRAGESTEEARKSWMKLQDARVENGYTRQPMSELLRAPQSQTKREKQTVEGVQFNRTNKRFVEEQI